MISRPVILAVDDEPEALSELINALARRFGGDYRVVSHLSPEAALADLDKMKEAGEPVALVIADQWMPGMTGLEMLIQVHMRHPEARRALLVAWGDKESSAEVLRGCMTETMDNYLRKPWAPAEVYLYPAVSGFLAEWTRAHGPKMELVRVVGEHVAPRSHEIRQQLEKGGIPHGFHLADSDEGKRILSQIGRDASRLPVVALLDGQSLVDPSDEELWDALGASNFDEDGGDFDVAIVGEDLAVSRRRSMRPPKGSRPSSLSAKWSAARPAQAPSFATISASRPGSAARNWPSAPTSRRGSSAPSSSSRGERKACEPKATIASSPFPTAAKFGRRRS